MKRINLQRGYFTLVDDEDYEKFKNYTWCVGINKKQCLVGVMSGDTKRGKRIILHRKIMNCPKGKVIDHINGNVLDNRKCNLRICTAAENVRNAKLSSRNKSGYKGVYWHKGRKQWNAQIVIKTIKKHLGYYVSIIDAAKAYDKAAIKYFGEFARTNKDLGLL